MVRLLIARLVSAQLETLAIVAYRQPITRPEVDEIRGVDSSATLRLLMDRALIRILGKKEDVGRPILYGTTKEFLDFFSLGDLRELPTLREYSELTDESRQVMSDELGIDPDDDGSSIDADADDSLDEPKPESIENTVSFVTSFFLLPSTRNAVKPCVGSAPLRMMCSLMAGSITNVALSPKSPELPPHATNAQSTSAREVLIIMGAILSCCA
jgi:hypothetical protein